MQRLLAPLKPGGRCVFAAWAETERNPLLPIPLFGPYRAEPAAQEPFLMVHTDATEALLRDAGFVGAGHRTVEGAPTLPTHVVYSERLLD